MHSTRFSYNLHTKPIYLLCSMEDRKSLGSSIAAIFDDGDDIIKRPITGEHTEESLAVRCDSVQLKLKKRMKVRKKSWFRTVTQ